MVTVATARENIILQIVDGADNSITPSKLRALLTDMLDATIASVPVAKLNATSQPTANDDISNTSGNGLFTVGSFWIDTAGNKSYRCVDASTEAAIWIETTLSTGDLGALAVLSTVGTTEINDDAVTLAKIADAALSGVDATLMTGTAGASGKLAQFNADGDIVDSAVATADIIPVAYTKNYIINPGMRISQENGTSSGTTNGYYPADQWIQLHSQDGTLTAAQVASATPGGSTHRTRLTVTAGDASIAAGQHAFLEQRIEGSQVADFLWGTASARDIIVRFGFKGPAGTYAVSIRNAAVDRSFVREFTITGGQANTDTVQTVTIPGDTSGTWPPYNVLGMVVNVTFATGSTYQTTAGAWQAGNFLGTSSTTNGIATSGSVFELFDVGMYLDPNSTGVAPDFVLPSYDDDLMACQRYGRKWGAKAIGVWTASTTARVLGDLHVPFRTVPTATLLSTTPIIEHYTSSTHTASGATIVENLSTAEVCEITVNGFTTARTMLDIAYAPSDFIFFSARM